MNREKTGRERLTEWASRNSTTTNCLLIRKLREKFVVVPCVKDADKMVAVVLETIGDICPHCWDRKRSECHCWE